MLKKKVVFVECPLLFETTPEPKVDNSNCHWLVEFSCLNRANVPSKDIFDHMSNLFPIELSWNCKRNRLINFISFVEAKPWYPHRWCIPTFRNHGYGSLHHSANALLIFCLSHFVNWNRLYFSNDVLPLLLRLWRIFSKKFYFFSKRLRSAHRSFPDPFLFLDDDVLGTCL